MAKDLIKTIIDKVNSQLMDDGFTRWPKENLMSMFNDAQRAVVLLRPDANIVEAAFPCVAGTKQTLPDEGLRVIDIRSNQSGSDITYRSRDELNDLYPEWYGTTGEQDPESFIYDERQPKRFFLYPGVALGVTVDLIYSAVPTRHLVGDYDSGVSDLDDIYTNAVVEYMLYMAHSKDFEYSEQAKAQTHFQMFNALLGAKSQADAGMTPTNKK